MALKILYQSKEKSKNGSQQKYKVTYYGKENQIDSLIATLEIGTSTAEGCYLSSWTKSNYGADLYQVVLEYTQSYEWGSYSNVPSTVVGKKSATLSVRNIQLPIEWLKDHGSQNYLTNWNYYLIGRAESEDESIETPAWWETAQTPIIPIADRTNYRWIKSISELPLEADTEGKYWFIVEQPQKPGVQVLDYALFVVTESAKYRTASAAGSAINKSINTITSPSNTFGLNWGDWKLDQASVSYDGKAWIGTCVYTHSGDDQGWDTDLYS